MVLSGPTRWYIPPNRLKGAGNYSHYGYIVDCNGSPTHVQLLVNWALWCVSWLHWCSGQLSNLPERGLASFFGNSDRAWLRSSISVMLGSAPIASLPINGLPKQEFPTVCRKLTARSPSGTKQDFAAS